MARDEEDPPEIRAGKVESHAAKRARLDPDNRRNFYQMAPHVVAAGAYRSAMSAQTSKSVMVPSWSETKAESFMPLLAGCIVRANMCPAFQPSRIQHRRSPKKNNRGVRGRPRIRPTADRGSKGVADAAEGRPGGV